MLKALVYRAPGIRAALTCAAVRPPRSSQPSRPNWLVVSMTTLPSSDPACARTSSTSVQETESITTSPNATASRGVPARPPISAASASSFCGSREKLTSTSWPALAKSRAALPPMRPAPITAMRIAQTPSASMTSEATLRPLYCCWPVMSRPSRTANAFHRPPST